MDFVTFEIALKLREKGFREECIAYYHTDGELLYNRDQYRGGNYKSLLRSYNSLPKNPIGCEQIDAPTISQVMKWLREEKKLHIELWTVGKKPIKWCHTITTLNHVGEQQGWSSGKRGDSYEQAALAGVNYCLDNLI